MSDNSDTGRRSRSDSRSPRRSKSPVRRSRSPVRSRSRSRSRSGSSDYENGARLHVADLDESVSKSELTKIFEKYGPLEDVWLARTSPAFAFVVFKDKYDAEEALRGTDGMSVAGEPIRVTVARPRTRGRGGKGFNPNMRCYQCGRKGHFSRDCYGGGGGGGRDRYRRSRSRSYSPRRRRPAYRRNNYYRRRY